MTPQYLKPKTATETAISGPEMLTAAEMGLFSVPEDPQSLESVSKRIAHLVDYWKHSPQYTAPLYDARAVDCPIEIRLNLSGRTAGTYGYRFDRHTRVYKDSININHVLLAKYPEEMYSRTIPHEVAHLIVGRTFEYPEMLKQARSHQPRLRIKQKHAPHGYAWSHVMQDVFQIPADRCHKLDMSHLDHKKPFIYACSCPGRGNTHRLSSVVHNRILQGQTRICRNCRSSLTFCHDERNHD